MSSLIERYNKVSEYWAGIQEGGWADWFDESKSTDAHPLEATFSHDLIAQFIDEGLTYWDSPRWIRDVWQLLEDWALDGKLIRVQLTCDWLTSQLPSSPLDDEIAANIRKLACGEFCEVFEGEFSMWPRKPECYVQALQWRMVHVAIAREQELAPAAFEQWSKWA